MGEWTIEIGDAGSSVTIDASAAFDIRKERGFTDNDRLEYVDYTCTVRGDITSGDVVDGFLELAALVDLNSSVPVTVSKDGEAKFEWLPEAGFVGPHVVAFASNPDKGNGHSHWKYELTIVFRAKPDGNENDLYSFTTSFTTVKDKERIIRQVWRASGKARTRAAAVAGVLAFKPSSQEVSEQLTESSTESSAEAVWVWEALQRITCRVHRTGAKDFSESGQVGVGVGPVLHRLSDRARIITISGVVRGYEPGLVAPPAHLTESDTVTRVDSREGNDDQAVETPEKGIYELRFQEVWLVTGAVPAIKHAGQHHLIELTTAPAPGAILS